MKTGLPPLLTQFFLLAVLIISGVALVWLNATAAFYGLR